MQQTAAKPQTVSFRVIGAAIMCALILIAALLTLVAFSNVFQKSGASTLRGTSAPAVFTRAQSAEDEGYDEDSTRCEVEYLSPDGRYSYTVTYSYEEWEDLPEGHTVTGIIFFGADDVYAVFETPIPTESEIGAAFRSFQMRANGNLFNAAMALLLAAIGFGVMTFTGRFFTLYEKCWFISVLVLAAVFAILFPEEDVNGVNGLVIMALYLLDTFLNILCELLISKQSKWNFIVSVFVEITEIAICLVLAYRFATMVSTLFFWLPIDIISFINWHRHPDRRKDELTEVRRMPVWLSLILFAAIIAASQAFAFWTDGVFTGNTDLFGGDNTLETIVNHIDWFATFIAIANGLFIFFRFEEQWFAWILDAIAEAAINIISGQYVLLVLKAGYLTNSTYGFIKWRKYIKSHPEALKRSFF